MRWAVNGVLILVSTIGYAQDPAVNQAIERIMVTLPDDVSDIQQLQDELWYYYQHPMSIQTDEPSKLAEHPLISFADAFNICFYRSEAGDILDWGELANVSGISIEWIELRKPFLTLSGPVQEWRSELGALRELQLQVGLKSDMWLKRGYREGEFAGPPFQDQGRLRLGWKNFHAGIRWQRDAGEPWNVRQGYDHLAGYLLWQPRRGSTISIGTHRLGLFSGLLHGTTFNATWPIGNDIHIQTGLTKPSDGAAEHQLWKGVQTNQQFGKWQLKGFIGFTSRDARIEGNEIVSLPMSGLHRTTSELANYKATSMRTCQSQLRYSGSSWNLSHAVQITRSAHTMHSTQYWGGQSLYGQLTYHSMLLSSEIAHDLSGRIATQVTLSGLRESALFGVRFHYIAPEYQSDLFPIQTPYFSGSGILSTTGFFTLKQDRWNLNTALFYAHQGGVNAKVKRGIQARLYHSTFHSAWELLWRRRTTDEISKNYIRAWLEWSEERLKTRIRMDSHFSNPELTSVSLSGLFEIERNGFRARVLVFAHHAHKGTPLYHMIPTTSMQMRMGALHGRGAGCAFHLMKRWRMHTLQLGVQFDRRLDSMERGSGLDLVERPYRYEISLEYHLRLRLNSHS